MILQLFFIFLFFLPDSISKKLSKTGNLGVDIICLSLAISNTGGWWLQNKLCVACLSISCWHHGGAGLGCVCQTLCPDLLSSTNYHTQSLHLTLLCSFLPLSSLVSLSYILACNHPDPVSRPSAGAAHKIETDETEGGERAVQRQKSVLWEKFFFFFFFGGRPPLFDSIKLFPHFICEDTMKVSTYFNAMCVQIMTLRTYLCVCWLFCQT